MTIIFDLIKSIHITSDLSALKREICLEYNLQNKPNFRSEDFHNLAYNISKRFKPCKGNRKTGHLLYPTLYFNIQFIRLSY